jgi:2-dehydro-3-deoxyphosphogluconate aldolase / (4S)-4-hydroxy-2-oxoglutarate aldolase
MTSARPENSSLSTPRREVPAEILQRLAPSPVVAILRAPDADRFVQAAEILYEAGFRCLEFTMTTAGAIAALEKVRTTLPENLLLGVGTVRSVTHVDDAVAAGADFLVSQVFRPHLVDAAHDLGVPFMPGALTPTEILDAWESGVAAVKVSPIGPVGGLEYFDQLRGPLPDVPLMPTGGVGLEEVTTYLAHGAVAVGLSGPLLGDSLEPGGDWHAMADRADTVVRALSES